MKVKLTPTITTNNYVERNIEEVVLEEALKEFLGDFEKVTVKEVDNALVILPWSKDEPIIK